MIFKGLKIPCCGAKLRQGDFFIKKFDSLLYFQDRRGKIIAR